MEWVSFIQLETLEKIKEFIEEYLHAPYQVNFRSFTALIC